MLKMQAHAERSHGAVEIYGANWRRDDPGLRPAPSQIAKGRASGGSGWKMRRHVWQAGLAAIAISLGALSADAVAEDHARDAAGAPANSPEQIKRAQAELQRLDCLQGRIDGKLGDRTREAMKKFWAMAKQPAVEVNITDELISNLAEHGDNFCRPPRRFFGFGGHALPPMFAPGARPGFVPPTAVRPPSPDVEPH